MDYIFLLGNKLGKIALNTKKEPNMTTLSFNALTTEECVALKSHTYSQAMNEFVEKAQSPIFCTEQQILDLCVSNNKEAKLQPLKDWKDVRRTIYGSFGATESLAQHDSLNREVAFLVARKALQDETKAHDIYIAQSILAVDDLSNNMNLIVGRLVEFYGIHFPELAGVVRDNRQYLRLIAEVGYRENFTAEKIANLSEDRRSQIFDMLGATLGAQLEPIDYKPIQEMAKLGLLIDETKGRLEAYIEETLTQVCPNLVALVGPLLAARLLAAAGSLYNLSKAPSSTIQVLGAEKALFRHLRKGAPPPKHGLIFQSSLIHQSPKWQRGKIARLLAGKISIAAKIDYFSKENRSEALLQDLNKHVEEIRQKFATPPPKKFRKPEFKGKGKFQDRSRQKFKKHHKNKSAGEKQ